MQCVKELEEVNTLTNQTLTEHEAKIANRRFSLVLLAGYISSVNKAVERLIAADLLDCETLLKIDEHLFLKRRQLEQITKEAIKEVYF